MREERTPTEQHAIDSLVKALESEGFNVSQIPDITDRPDAALIVGGRTVAVECRTYTSEKVLQLHGIKIERDKPYQLYFPLEPHIWVKSAIEAKAKKVEDYIKRCNADACWLVLHSERGGFAQLGDMYSGELSKLFLYGAWSIKHSFERIYLTGEDGLPPVCLYNIEDDEIFRDKYSSIQIQRLPVQRFLFANVVATEGENGEGKITFNFNQKIIQNILLQPLDKRFKVDYSGIENIENAFISLQHLPGMIYAKPV